MNLGEEAYQRLGRSGGRGSGVFPSLFRKTKLFLGRDHLLLVESTGFSEQYKRFYYRDIQAITITKTNRAEVYNANLGFIVAACLLVLAALIIPSAADGFRSPPSVTAVIFFGTFGTLSLIALIANIALGPSAVCHVRTAVQLEELGPLNRMRRARKALDRIRPRILEAQAEFKEARVEAPAPSLVEAVAPELSTPRVEAPRVRRPLERADRLASGALATTLILNASALSFGGALGSAFCYVVASMLSVAAVIAAIPILARSRDRLFPPGLLSVAKLSITEVVLYYFIITGYAGYLNATLAREEPQLSAFAVGRALVLPAPLGAALAIFSGILGFAALYLLWKYPYGQAPAPAAAPPPLPPPPPPHD